MSGRSAYVRKKITQTGPGGGSGSGGSGGGSEKGGSGAAGRGRAKSSAASSSDDNATISEFPLPIPLSRQDTGVGVATTNARFLKFSEPIRESEVLVAGYPGYGSHSGGSQSEGSTDGRRDATPTPQFKGPLQDFAYARARRPVIKTEDVSGIEKSGLRSVLDKKSETVRRGIAKTFTFRKKDKRAAEEAEEAAAAALEFRPQSSATVRPNGYPSRSHQSPPPPPPLQGELDFGYDSPFDNDVDVDSEPPPSARRQQHRFLHQHQHRPWEADPSIANTTAAAPPPTVPLPPIKRWIGGGRPVQRWNKLRKDPELWDPDGDVLVFLGHQSQQPRLNPSFRLSSHIIEATESRYLIMLLREGSNERDMGSRMGGRGGGLSRTAMLQRQGSLSSHHAAQPQLHHEAQSPVSASEDSEADPDISYELYFPSPPNMTRIDQLRYHITTRNVFAVMYHASLVGLSLHQTLSDLHARLDTYMSGDSDNLGAIVQYLAARGLDDVRGDVEAAVSLLGWAESPEVRWDEGWREAFLHCAGMYARVEACADFKSITPITRALLERACLETQLRVQAAEERLAEFAYSDMWPPAVATAATTSGPVAPSPAKAAADRLQSFLLSYYSRVYGCWPPPPPPPMAFATQHEGMVIRDAAVDDMWLTRSVAKALQRDFSALYDYLVNRDIIWDGSEARSGRKWMLVSETGNRAFEPDSPDLPMTDMLVEFDNRLRFPHIPHPYPLVPESIAPTVVVPPAPSGVKEKLSKKNGGGGGGGGNNAASNIPTSGRAAAMERRVALAYNEASNTLLLGSEFIQSDLIDAFTKFEKADRVCEVDPSTARRGRWVLIYGVLQTLASVSVDTPNMRYCQDVPYHLSPRLKGAKMPPWKSAGSSSLSQEASHELSHCWLVPRVWAGASASGTESAESGGSGNTSPMRGEFGFPRPPTASSTTRSRSSNTGYRASSTGPARSVRSAGSAAPSLASYPPFSSAASIASESDAASSVMTPMSNSSRKGRSGTMKSINEVEWPVQGQRSREQELFMLQQLQQLQHQQHPQHPQHPQHLQQHRHQQQVPRHRSSSRGRELEQLTLALPQSGTGGFLDDVMGDAKSYTTSPTGREDDNSRGSGGGGGDGGGGGGGGGGGASDRAVLGRGGPRSASSSRSRAAIHRREAEVNRSRPMVIRDFDDLEYLSSRAP